MKPVLWLLWPVALCLAAPPQPKPTGSDERRPEALMVEEGFILHRGRPSPNILPPASPPKLSLNETEFEKFLSAKKRKKRQTGETEFHTFVFQEPTDPPDSVFDVTEKSAESTENPVVITSGEQSSTGYQLPTLETVEVLGVTTAGYDFGHARARTESDSEILDNEELDGSGVDVTYIDLDPNLLNGATTESSEIVFGSDGQLVLGDVLKPTARLQNAHGLDAFEPMAVDEAATTSIATPTLTTTTSETSTTKEVTSASVSVAESERVETTTSSSSQSLQTETLTFAQSTTVYLEPEASLQPVEAETVSPSIPVETSLPSTVEVTTLTSTTTSLPVSDFGSSSPSPTKTTMLVDEVPAATTNAQVPTTLELEVPTTSSVPETTILGKEEIEKIEAPVSTVLATSEEALTDAGQTTTMEITTPEVVEATDHSSVTGDVISTKTTSIAVEKPETSSETESTTTTPTTTTSPVTTATEESSTATTASNAIETTSAGQLSTDEEEQSESSSTIAATDKVSEHRTSTESVFESTSSSTLLSQKSVEITDLNLGTTAETLQSSASSSTSLPTEERRDVFADFSPTFSDSLPSLSSSTPPPAVEQPPTDISTRRTDSPHSTSTMLPGDESSGDFDDFSKQKSLELSGEEDNRLDDDTQGKSVGIGFEPVVTTTTTTTTMAPPAYPSRPATAPASVSAERLQYVRGEKGDKGDPGPPGVCSQDCSSFYSVSQSPTRLSDDEIKRIASHPAFQGARANVPTTPPYATTALPPYDPRVHRYTSKGEKGDIGPMGPPGPPGVPGVGSGRGTPGLVSVYPTSTELFGSASATPIGQLAFSVSSQQLFIRVNNGWQLVRLEGFYPAVEQRPPVTAAAEERRPSPSASVPEVRTLAPPVEKPKLLEPQPETTVPKPTATSAPLRPVHRQHREKRLHLIALNRPMDGNLKGVRGADLQCYHQARQAGFKTTFRAFVSSRVQDLVNIVHFADHDSPVVNAHGQRLFDSWTEVLSPEVGPRDLPIYSFNQRNIYEDSEFADRYVWHGSDDAGRRLEGGYCEGWRSSDSYAHGMASSLLRGRPLISDGEQISCRRRLIVLCVENMSKFNIDLRLRQRMQWIK